MSEFRGGGLAKVVRGYKEVRAKENLGECPAFTDVALLRMLGYHVVF